MKSRIILRCLIIASKNTAVLFGIVLLNFAWPSVSECVSGKGITSNAVERIAGNADTLWMLVWDGSKSQYSINATIHNGDNSRLNEDKYWASLSLGCINTGIYDLAYGGGKALICFDTLKWKQENPLLLLSYDGNSIHHKRVDLKWPEKLKESTVYQLTAVTAVWSHGSFYFACLDGGLVKYDYQKEVKAAFSPGNSLSVPLEAIPDSNPKPDTSKRVIDLRTNGDNLIVVTPAKIWGFSSVDSSWDSSISSILVNSNFKFRSFETAYPSPDNTLYSRIKVETKGIDTTIFAKYSKARNNWQCMLEKPIEAVEFGPGGYIFTLSNDFVNIYRDTLMDSAVIKTPEISSSVFKNWITENFSIPDPIITDILYLDNTDSSGYFWVSSTDGIFLSRWKFPVPSEVDFIQIKRAPQIRSGLKQTYARPGILVNNSYIEEEARTVFIYNVSKSTNVTIRVYDFNMDLVKTVINNKFRRAGSDGGHHNRSTVESEDWWDGRNSAGKLVAPGVYYYKITTDIGERAFGKIVVAK